MFDGLGLGAHGGANVLVTLLPASMCEPDKAIRIALDERHAKKCAMRKLGREVSGLSHTYMQTMCRQ